MMKRFHLGLIHQPLYSEHPASTGFAFRTDVILRVIDSTRCWKHSSEMLVLSVSPAGSVTAMEIFFKLCGLSLSAPPWSPDLPWWSSGLPWWSPDPSAPPWLLRLFTLLALLQSQGPLPPHRPGPPFHPSSSSTPPPSWTHICLLEHLESTP